MTQRFERAQLEVLRIDLLNELDARKTDLDDAALEAALPGGSDASLVVIEKDIDRIRAKLRGVARGLEQVAAREEEERKAQCAKDRQEKVGDLLTVMHKRRWAIEQLDKLATAAANTIDDIEVFGHEIQRESSTFFDGDKAGQAARMVFLGRLEAFDLTDVVLRAQKEIAPSRPFASHPIGFQQAIDTLVAIVPEAGEEAFMEDVKKRARDA